LHPIRENISQQICGSFHYRIEAGSLKKKRSIFKRKDDFIAANFIPTTLRYFPATLAQETVFFNFSRKLPKHCQLYCTKLGKGKEVFFLKKKKRKRKVSFIILLLPKTLKLFCSRQIILLLPVN
jgi:hypothetical protein